MALSDIDSLRVRIADRPSFHREEQAQEETGNTFFRLDFNNILDDPEIIVRKNGTVVPAADYTLDADNGTVTFDTAPAVNDNLVFEYTSVVFTTVELQHFLDEAVSPTLAAANVLLAWAADYARLAHRESLSGGAGMGSVTVGVDNRARELRETAKAYYLQYQQFEAAGVAAEGITEVPWNSYMEDRMIVNHLMDISN